MNRFVSLVSAYVRLGYITQFIFQSNQELSPIDETAEGIITLCQFHNLQHTVFHLCNDKTVKFK
jgi:predicted aminopeptidase